MSLHTAAAISAVSRVEITTCRAGGSGAVLRLEGGVPGAVEPVGAPQGTDICVRDLFYNTPAAREDQVSLEGMAEGAVADIIRRTQVDALSPLEALNLLYELKSKLQ